MSITAVRRVSLAQYERRLAESQANSKQIETIETSDEINGWLASINRRKLRAAIEAQSHLTCQDKKVVISVQLQKLTEEEREYSSYKQSQIIYQITKCGVCRNQFLRIHNLAEEEGFKREVIVSLDRSNPRHLTINLEFLLPEYTLRGDKIRYLRDQGTW